MGSVSIIVLLFCGIIFAVLAIGIGKLFGLSSTNPEKGQPYECGIETKGVTWVQFNVGYYLFSLVFLIFDVEIVFLYPWATVLKEIGMVAFVEILVFTVFLFMGLLYAYKKKALSWM
jgi:NADH:ubiquinone oxidoreductase subunit 3 (subunit A)